jgi:hypothetical protein
MIARALGVSRLEAAAMCMSVWEWAQDNDTVDRITATTDSNGQRTAITLDVG